MEHQPTPPPVVLTKEGQRGAIRIHRGKFGFGGTNYLKTDNKQQFLGVVLPHLLSIVSIRPRRWLLDEQTFQCPAFPPSTEQFIWAALVHTLLLNFFVPCMYILYPCSSILLIILRGKDVTRANFSMIRRRHEIISILNFVGTGRDVVTYWTLLTLVD